jgi:hypothetical protein
MGQRAGGHYLGGLGLSDVKKATGVMTHVAVSVQI